ncbi:MAG: hypothetical protein QM780_05495 [Hyphomicrobium sp.]|uniref:hypothetical protein n=1 Tax=Hyphomicrobium sp. TaxID=82 RepID=UPI0039E569E2
MSAQDNDSGARTSSAASSTSALKWVAIAILALLAMYGWQQKSSAEGELTALRGEVASLQKAVDDAAEVRKSSQDEIDRLKSAVADAQRQVDEGKADVSTAMAKVSELDNKVAGLTKDNEGLQAKLAAAGDAAKKLTSEFDVANKAKSDAESAANALRGEIDSLKGQIATLQKDLDAAKAAAQQATPPATPAPAPETPAAP